jgi:hypothetical protein
MTEAPLAPQPRSGRIGKLALRLSIACAAFIILLELGFRTVLFLDVPGLRTMSLRLRAPQNFFTRYEPDYWTSSVLFTPEERLKPVPGYDPLLGWRGSRVEAETFAHKDENVVLTRRPVLLYGDSFAECTTGPKECWQGLLNASPLRTTHFLVNYGVGGYGLDQIYLLLRGSIGRFAEQDPIVIVSVLIDDDLDRSLLPFRGWPKPRFGLEHGALVEPEPVAASVEEYLAEHPPDVWSWAWRYLRHQQELRRGSPPEADEPRRAEVRELSRALLREIQRELDSRGVQWFFLIFQGESMLNKAGRDQIWQYPFMVETLRELGIPFVSSRDALVNHRKLTGTDPSLYFEAKGRGKGHFTPLGNAAVFPAILRGIEGQFD